MLVTITFVHLISEGSHSSVVVCGAVLAISTTARVTVGKANFSTISSGTSKVFSSLTTWEC